MKITSVTTTVSSVAKDHPVRDAIQTLDRDGRCLVRIETDDGVVGESSTYFGREEASPALLAHLVD
ncbi:L-alanine-DL-glutamate epimerase-like enolase superfamily enzyme, partial [Friedmanniella antarctica]